MSSITIKEFAKQINGKQYSYSIFTKEELSLAKENGFVIIHGASDDLIEFEGAIRDEGDCYDGGDIYFDKTGVNETGKNHIEAVWCGEGKATWSYKTEIPHEKFLLYEDEEEYCEGIVFSISDIK